MKDMKGKKCRFCNTGTYEEEDEWSHGTLTCNFEECRATIVRWQGDYVLEDIKKKPSSNTDKEKLKDLSSKLDKYGTYSEPHARLNNEILLSILEQLMEIKKKL